MGQYSQDPEILISNLEEEYGLDDPNDQEIIDAAEEEMDNIDEILDSSLKGLGYTVAENPSSTIMHALITAGGVSTAAVGSNVSYNYVVAGTTFSAVGLLEFSYLHKESMEELTREQEDYKDVIKYLEE